MATRQNNRSVVIPALLARALESRRAFSSFGFTLLVPFGILITVNSYSPITMDLSVQTLALIGVVGMLAAGSVLLLGAGLAQSPGVTYQQRAIFTLVIYALAGIARSGLSYFLVASESIIDFNFLNLLRISALGAMHGLVWLSVIAILLFLADSYRSNRSELTSLQQQLQAYQNEMQASLQQDVEQVQEMIRSRLQPVLRRVTRQIQNVELSDSKILDAAEALRETCETEVRNLSHRLAEPTLDAEIKEILQEQISWRKLISIRFFKADLHVLAIYGITFYLGAFLVIAQERPQLLMHNSLALGAGLIVTLALYRLFWRKFQWRWRIAQVVIVYSISIAAIFIVLMQDFGYQEFPTLRLQNLSSVPIAFLLIWLIFTFLVGFQALGAEVALETEKLRHFFQQEQPRLRLRRDQLRKLLATLLHGNVQGSLAAVSLALVSSQSATVLAQRDLINQAETQLRRVQKDLNQILALDLAEIDFDVPDVLLSEDSIRAELMQWEGLLSVQLELPSTVLERANAAGLSSAVLLAIRESLQNSVRHGHARNVQIVLQELPNSLRLVITDDGNFNIAGEMRDGQGGREIRATGGERKILRADNRTQVEITWDFVSVV